MSPALLALIIGALEEAIKDTPQIVAEIQSIFAKENPTPQDWADLRAKVLSESFESLAPHAETTNAPIVTDPGTVTLDQPHQTASQPAIVVPAGHVLNDAGQIIPIGS